MTKDEVMAMTDKALQIKTAELMGAQWYTYGKVRSLEFWRPFRWHRAVGDESLGEGWDANIPDYPNDFAAAIDLVERAIDNGFMMKLKAWSGSLGTVWDCTFDRSDMDVNDSDEKAPRAITRAFILAMETINA